MKHSNYVCMHQFNIHVCRYVYSLWILNERRSRMDIDYITSHRYNYNTYKLMTNTWILITQYMDTGYKPLYIIYNR